VRLAVAASVPNPTAAAPSRSDKMPMMLLGVCLGQVIFDVEFEDGRRHDLVVPAQANVHGTLDFIQE